MTCRPSTLDGCIVLSYGSRNVVSSGYCLYATNVIYGFYYKFLKNNIDSTKLAWLYVKVPHRLAFFEIGCNDSPLFGICC
ncbi:hypothetical protein C7475_1011412 [Chitinophaga sp. S165]|nr:hypothetical protein C7475_1011412 [Chitinophaga sp. S165]